MKLNCWAVTDLCNCLILPHDVHGYMSVSSSKFYLNHSSILYSIMNWNIIVNGINTVHLLNFCHRPYLNMMQITPSLKQT